MHFLMALTLKVLLGMKFGLLLCVFLALRIHFKISFLENFLSLNVPPVFQGKYLIPWILRSGAQVNAE